MAVQSEVLNLRVRVDQKEAESELKKFGNTVQAAAAKGTVANTKLASSFEAVRIQVAKVRNLMLLWSFTIGATIFAIDKFFKAAQKIQGVVAGFENLGQRINATPKFIDKLRTATQGLVSDQQLMTQANNAIILGVAKTEDEFAKLVATATILGQALGVDSVRALESMTVGIGRQSRLMLDNLGIIVSVDDANRKLAKTLGLTVDEMSDAQKKQAFLNETLRKAEAAVAGLAPQTETLSTGWNRLKVNIENATSALLDYINTSSKLKGLPGVTPTGVILGTQGATVEQLEQARVEASNKQIALRAQSIVRGRPVSGKPGLDPLDSTELLAFVQAFRKNFIRLFGDTTLQTDLARAAQNAILQAMILGAENAATDSRKAFSSIGVDTLGPVLENIKATINIVSESRKLRAEWQSDLDELGAARAKAGVSLTRGQEGSLLGITDKGGDRSALEKILRQEKFGGTGAETQGEALLSGRDAAAELRSQVDRQAGAITEFSVGSKEFNAAVDAFTSGITDLPQQETQVLGGAGSAKAVAESNLGRLGLRTPDEIQKQADTVAIALKQLEDLQLNPEQLEIFRRELEGIGRGLEKEGGVVDGMRRVREETLSLNDAVGIFVKDGLLGLEQHMRETGEELESLSDTMATAIRREGTAAAEELGSTLVDAAFDGKAAWRDFFETFMRDIAKAITQALILKAITSTIGGGGAAAATPNSQGGVIPNSQGGVIPARQGFLLEGGTPGRDSILIAAQRREMILPAFISDFLVEAARSVKRAPRQDAETSGSGSTIVILQMNREDLPETIEDNPDAVLEAIRQANTFGAE